MSARVRNLDDCRMEGLSPKSPNNVSQPVAGNNFQSPRVVMPAPWTNFSLLFVGAGLPSRREFQSIGRRNQYLLHYGGCDEGAGNFVVFSVNGRTVPCDSRESGPGSGRKEACGKRDEVAGARRQNR